MAANSASTFTFVHAADLHLDTPFKGVHQLSPAVAHALQEASLAAFDNIVELAISKDAAFVVIGGDIYDGAKRGLRAQLHFRDGLGRLSKRGIQSFIVHGNHDPVVTGWSAINDSWPDGVVVFGSDTVQVMPVVRGGAQIGTVQGISYAVQATTENLSLRFKRPQAPGFHIGVLHCNVAGVGDSHSDYSPCTLSDLRASELDYFALGHVHQRRVLHESQGPQDPWVVYPGNSQARSPRRSEQEPKGALVVRVENGVVSNLDFVECDLVRFRQAECSIADLGDLGDLEDRLNDIASEELESADGRSILLRVGLTERGVVHEDLSRPGTLDDLLTRLRERAPMGSRFCWWDELEDVTLPSLDLDAVRGRGDFSSDLLELADLFMASELDRKLIANELVASVPKSMAGRLHAVVDDDAQFKLLFDRAVSLAFDEISRDAR